METGEQTYGMQVNFYRDGFNAQALTEGISSVFKGGRLISR